jgi:predicted DNA-binding WGR domain protein
MSYHIETHYLEHIGGTKFYETVRISEPSGPCLLIKRWGAIGVKNGGGQTKYERGDQATVLGEERQILNEKMKKGHSETPFAYGLHKSNRSTLSADVLQIAVHEHHGREIAEYVTEYFGLGAPGAVVSEEPHAPAPAASEMQDERWGSW